MRRFNFRANFICAALVLAAPLISFGQNAQEPIATVGGQSIYEQDLMSVAGAGLLDLRNQEYKLKSDALNTIIRKKLIAVEAKKKGITTEELVKQEVDSKIPEPSDAEAKGYYLGAKNQSTASFDLVKPQIKELLRNVEIQQAREKYEDSLRARTEISIRLQPPSVHLAYDSARVKGAPQAPVTVVEFSDFQCPFCKKTESTLNDLLTKYRGRVKLAYMDFPLRAIHPHAQKAAEAARCAGEQGKFWEYHDALYSDQTKLNGAELVTHARTLNLDEKSFQSCLDSGRFKSKVEADLEQGNKVGVAGTPGFFINGIFLNGAQPQAEFEKIIDNQLALLGDPHSSQ